MKNSLFKFAVLSLVTILSFSCSSEKEIAKTILQLSTNNASNITLTTATSGGNITTDGGAPVTSRGIVWNTVTQPTVSLATKTTDGSGIGDFPSAITNLNPSTNYYARAYATNSVGTGYGNEISFTTGAIVIPTLSTTAVTSITTNSAISGGTITNDGGGAVTARGIVWSTSQNPTIALTTKTSDGVNTGTYTSNLTNLAPNTTYFIRSYATNSAGTNYGNEISFKTQNINYAAMYPTGTVFCNNVVTAVVDVTNPVTGKTWMDRNLGASQVATSSTDALAYGDAYQWGRGSDGHQCRNSATTTTRSSTDKPSHGNFIITLDTPHNWRNPSNDNLWKGVNGINNPCPNGYRLPTTAEWTSEINSWVSKKSDGAFSSILKLPLTLNRYFENGDGKSFNQGEYWASKGLTFGDVLVFYNNRDAFIGGTIYFSMGSSVRCIKN